MSDPQHDQETGDFTITITGTVTDDAWNRLAAELEEIRRQHNDD